MLRIAPTFTGGFLICVGISLSDWIGCNNLEELKTNLFDLFGMYLDTFSLVYC